MKCQILLTVVFFKLRESSNFGQGVAKPPRQIFFKNGLCHRVAKPPRQIFFKNGLSHRVAKSIFEKNLARGVRDPLSKIGTFSQFEKHHSTLN